MLTIELLERSYGKHIPLLKNEQDYRASLEEIRQQEVAGPIFHILKENRSLQDVPVFFREGLERQREISSYGNLLIKSEADRIVAVMEREGIPAIVLKGTWLSQRLYGSIGVRSTGDVDLLVREEQREAAARVLNAAGFVDIDVQRHNSYHRSFGKWNTSKRLSLQVELHWHVVQTDYCRMDCETLWEHSAPLSAYKQIRELSVPDLFYTLCLHGAKHHMSSLKHVLDLVRTIHLFGAQISYEKLLQRAREERQYGMVIMALSVVYRLMPHLSRLKTFPEVRSWFPWNQELAWMKDEDYRSFRFKGIAYYLQQAVFAMGKLDLQRHRILFLWRSVFPHPEMIRAYLGRPTSDSGLHLYARWLGRFWLMRGHKARRGQSPDILLQGEDRR